MGKSIAQNCGSLEQEKTVEIRHKSSRSTLNASHGEMKGPHIWESTITRNMGKLLFFSLQGKYCYPLRDEVQKGSVISMWSER